MKALPPWPMNKTVIPKLSVRVAEVVQLIFSLLLVLLLSSPFPRCWFKRHSLITTLNSQLHPKGCFPENPTWDPSFAK